MGTWARPSAAALRGKLAKRGVWKASFCLPAFATTLAVVSGAHAQAATFALASGESKVQFVSDAPLERITGATTRVTGQIELDPAAPTQARGEIAVPVASIRTNNDLRDEHLRSDSWLDAERFPSVSFTLSGVAGLSALPLGQSTSANVRGKLSVHGVTRELATTAKVRLSQVDGKSSLRVQASFPVALEAHNVSIPSVVKLKVAPVIQVNVDLSAHASSPVVSTPEQPAAAAAEARLPAAQLGSADRASAASPPGKSTAKPRPQASDAGTRQRLPAAGETTRPEPIDAGQAEPSTERVLPAAPDAALHAPLVPAPSPSAPPADAPRAADEKAASHTASSEPGCSAASGPRETWPLPLLLFAAWLACRRGRR